MFVKRSQTFLILIVTFFLFFFLFCFCYSKVSKAISFPVKNILSDEEILKNSVSRQIFMIETNLDEERVLDNPRQACSVESAGN